jgi:hypothetical protein
MPFYEIKFLPEGTTREYYASRGNRYRFEDGAFLDMLTTPVWCRRCQELHDGEYIEPLSEIDQQLADLRNQNSHLYQWTQDSEAGPNGKFRMELIAEALRRREWRERRLSPPKCLFCGATDIVVLPLGNEIPCPFSAGTLIMECVGMYDGALGDWIFSPEGDRISMDENLV